MRKAVIFAFVICAVTAAIGTDVLAQDRSPSNPSDGWMAFAQKPPAQPPTAQHDFASPASGDVWLLTPTSAIADETAATTTQSDTTSQTKKLWEVKFKAYGWIPAINGHTGIGSVRSKVNVDYNDVLHSLDEIESMVPINLEARYDHWGFYTDLFYVKLKDKVRQGPVTANLKADQTILELAGFYRVGTWPLAPTYGKSLTLDVIGGARYNRLSGAVGLQAPSQAVSLGNAHEWWDPIVGSRIIWQASDKISLFARGDVGGFGIENCSHFTWQVMGGLEYNITENVFLEAGYRLLDTNYETGSGRNYFKYDIQMAGPYLALGVKF